MPASWHTLRISHLDLMLECLKFLIKDYLFFLYFESYWNGKSNPNHNAFSFGWKVNAKTYCWWKRVLRPIFFSCITWIMPCPIFWSNPSIGLIKITIFPVCHSPIEVIHKFFIMKLIMYGRFIYKHYVVLTRFPIKNR